MFAKGLALGFAFAVAGACNAAEEIDLLLGDIEEAPVVEECALLGDCSLNLGERLRNRDPLWFAGVEATFLDVRSRTGGRITASFDDSDTAGTEIAFRDGEGIDTVSLAPRFWLGRQFGERWGVVGRYWRLEDSELSRPDLNTDLVTTPLPTFGTYEQRDRVEGYTIDVEGVRTFRPGKWTFDGTIGARHLSMLNESQFHAFGVITSGNFANLLLANGSQFEGTGVTMSLTGRRQIGRSPIYFFATLRGANAYGQTDSFGRSAGAVASSPSSPLVGAATVTRNNADARMEIIETQIGLDIEHQLRCCRAKAFFRVAGEYQYWELSGRPTGGAGFGGTINDLTTNSFASAGLGDTRLIGLALSTGLTW